MSQDTSKPGMKVPPQTVECIHPTKGTKMIVNLKDYKRLGHKLWKDKAPEKAPDKAPEKAPEKSQAKGDK